MLTCLFKGAQPTVAVGGAVVAVRVGGLVVEVRVTVGGTVVPVRVAVLVGMTGRSAGSSRGRGNRGNTTAGER